ncbi:MAG: hypothetical protein LBT50_06260 [Prevotellaceae bacterium]|jgi:hypothetical protein|nr:hypothetical protein [Prevotellaceae bacterium]
MTTTQDFFINILQLVDNNLKCSLQTSDNSLINVIKQMKNVKIYDSDSVDILLNLENKQSLINHIIAYNSEEFIYHFEILRNNEIIFISHDGFEIATISSNVQLSEDFITKFVDTGTCIIVD